MTELDSEKLIVTDTDPAEVVIVSRELRIPRSELAFRFSRSGGPGGQHVNRTETRVELMFDVANSPSLLEGQRTRILGRLAGHVDGDGVLHVISSATRSQARNREDAVQRLRALLAGALRRRKRRVPTKPSRSSREARLDRKRRRSSTKKARQWRRDSREE